MRAAAPIAIALGAKILQRHVCGGSTLRLAGLAILLVMVFAACGSGSDSGAGVEPGSSLSSEDGRIRPEVFSNDQVAYNYFLSKGLTAYQAAGIVGNLDQESGVTPICDQGPQGCSTQPTPGSPGRGIAQWSAGARWDTDKNDNATWYASTQGQSVDSLQLQLAFIWYELVTFSNYGLSALESSTNVTDATLAFMTAFEGCGQCEQSQRLNYAQAALNAFIGTSGGGPVSSGNPSGCTANGVSGVCMDTSQCNGTSVPGQCPGDSNIQCCIDAGRDGGGDDGGVGVGSSSGGSISASSILQVAQSGLGNSFYWGHARWGDGGAAGTCSGNCPSCTHTGVDGADCSGFVAKAWQLDGTPTTTDTHPYSTASFIGNDSRWTHISDRSSAQPGDAFVYNDGSEGHIVIYVGGDASGSIRTYQAAGCAKGILAESMTLGSAYQLIRRAGVGSSSSGDGDGDGGSDAGGGGSSCTASGLPGQCTSTSACSAQSESTSVPGFCPGPTDIQCCVSNASTSGPACTTDDECSGSTPNCCDPNNTGAAHCSANACTSKPSTSALPNCSTDSDCASGQSCCDNDGDGASHCTTQTCATSTPVQNQCATDSDCSTGQICEPDSRACVSNDGGPCTNDGQCPSRDTCQSGTCSSGQLGSQCAESSQCATGLTCDPTSSQCSSGNTSGCSDASDCSNSQVCDVSSGQCVASSVTGCQTDGDCASGQTCDTTQGACVASSAGCASDSDCPSGQTCDTTQSVCVSSTGCQSDGDCPPGQTCDTSRSLCVGSSSGGCQSDGDCPSGQTCDTTQSVCLASVGGCQSDSDCPSGQTCDTTQTPPACITAGCQSDSDCSSDQICDMTQSPPACVGAGCESDADCPAGQTCDTTQSPPACIVSGCQSDSDCASGDSCDMTQAPPACVTGCLSDADCAPGQTCDMTQSPPACAGP